MEPGSYEPTGIGAVGVTGSDVTARAVRVDERDDHRSPVEVPCSDVVDEDVVDATK
jgi:hypothetical protein